MIPPEPKPRGVRLFNAWNRRLPTAGVLALACLLLAVITGVLLGTIFDVHSPEASLRALSLMSPGGRIIQALHAWAGHWMIVLGALHVVEHLARKTPRKLKAGVWVRASVALPALILVMLTGFMLRGDGEAELARMVLTGFLGGDEEGSLAWAVFGAPGDLQGVYLHHLATTTVALWIASVEHGKRFWPSASAFLGVLAVAALGSYLLPPSLHNGWDPALKGPWYFLGLQELLHWLSQPLWSLIPLAFIWGGLIALRKAKEGVRRWLVRGLNGALAGYLVLTVIAALFRGPGWSWIDPFESPGLTSQRPRSWRPLSLASAPARRAPVAGEQVEGCLLCHDQVQGMSPSHMGLGCARCHLGDPTSPDAERAHGGLVAVPGNLDTAALTCGQAGCHLDLLERVEGSLMGTGRGLIAVDRFVFGEQDTPDGTDSWADLGHSPADAHLRQMCATCHLGRIKPEPAPISEMSRGGGCVACHIRYPEGERATVRAHAPLMHPRLTVRVTDDHCFGCHSRSGRISMGYAGWSETTREPEEVKGESRFRVLEDGRVLAPQTPDVHFERGMGCVDCHTARETMGDGTQHLHQEDQTEVRCEDCHQSQPERVILPDALDAESLTLLGLRGQIPNPEGYVAAARSGMALVNVEMQSGRVSVRSKIKEKTWRPAPPDAACQGPDHEALSCQACHTSWAHHCVGCHTQYDPKGDSLDLISGELRPGEWVEYGSEPDIDLPTLGVRVRGGERVIEPFIPGMVMTLNARPPKSGVLPDGAQDAQGPETRFLRLYAPAVPHTITTRSRSCQSCHFSSLAIGAGRGALEFDAGGWKFTPTYEPLRYDGLPADAWVGFLRERLGTVSTRTDARPLTPAEQRRVLRVGACLTCHAHDESPRIYEDFGASLERRTPACKAPR